MKIKNRMDFLTGIGIVAFCCLVLTQTVRLAAEVAMFPKAIMAVGIGIGIALVIKSFLKDAPPKKERKPFTKFKVIEAAILVFVILALAFAKTIGLFTTTFWVMSAVMLYIAVCQYGINWKRFCLTIGYNVLVVAVLYVLFAVVLKIRLPNGLFI